MRCSLIALLGLAACASSGASSGSAPSPEGQSVQVVGPTSSTTIAMRPGDPSTSRALPYAMERVWRALPAAFDSLGIPVTTVDPSTRTFGNSGFKPRRQLKSTPLSRYIDCGTTQLGPNADNYDVFLTFTVQVRSVEAASTNITTNLTAAARPPNYAQEYSACSSRGTLEDRVVQMLQRILATT